jgi:hypothetical protein
VGLPLRQRFPDIFNHEDRVLCLSQPASLPREDAVLKNLGRRPSVGSDRKEHKMANIQPNQYSLQSNDGKRKVEYETSTFAGHAILNLSQETGAIRHFTGSQIRTRNTEIGILISVTTQVSVDIGSTSFSLLIPPITLTGVGDTKSFETTAVITSHTGPNSVPSTGVHETYQFIPMKGEARLVLALLEPVVGAVSQAAGKK